MQLQAVSSIDTGLLLQLPKPNFLLPRKSIAVSHFTEVGLNFEFKMCCQLLLPSMALPCRTQMFVSFLPGDSLQVSLQNSGYCFALPANQRFFARTFFLKNLPSNVLLA